MDEDEALIARLSQRLHKQPAHRARHTSSLVESEPIPTHTVAPFVPPRHTSRNINDLMDPLAYRPPKIHDDSTRSTLRYVLDSLDEGKHFSDILPMRIESDHAVRPELFPDLDEDTEKQINRKYKDDMQQRMMFNRDMDIDDSDPTERPKSPGAEYDMQFIPGEFGIAKPRFRADVHEKMFQADRTISKSQLESVMAKATDVERSLMNRYQRFTSIDAIQRKMVRDSKKARRKAKDH